jgi:glycosyltransferase involved in cell wall biosynthesis
MYKKNLPLITVGLSFYNNEKTLANAIKSVLLQTYTNFEFILIDDGSTDMSYKLAEKFVKSDSRIRLIKGGTNKGFGYRLNQITDLARGEYIARMDADDMMLPEKIEKQMAVLIKNKHIDLTDCLAYIIDNNDTPVGKRKVNDLSNLNLGKILKERTVFFHPTVIAKTSWFRKNKYNENFKRGQDFELWCRTWGKTTYERVEEYLFLYREGNVNIKNYKLSSENIRKTLKLYYFNNLSSIELKKEIFLTHFKTFLYQFLGFLNLQFLLSGTRNLKLNKSEKIKINDHIKAVVEYNQPHFNSNRIIFEVASNYVS